MTSQTFVLLSGTLTFGVPMMLAIRELLTLPPPRGDDGPPPDEPFVPGPKPLPDCLLPAPSPIRKAVRVRQLEDA